MMSRSAAAAVSPVTSEKAERRLSPTSVSEVSADSSGSANSSQDKKSECEGASSFQP